MMSFGLLMTETTTWPFSDRVENSSQVMMLGQ